MSARYGLLALLLLAACKMPAGAETLQTHVRGAPGDPKDYLEGLYSTYYGPAAEASLAITLPREDAFDRAMLALMKEDSELNAGDIGALDADPLCNCQDFQGLTATVTIKTHTATTARAKVVVANGAGEYRRTDNLTVDLVTQDGAWRIHDIQPDGAITLRERLRRSIAEAAKR